MAGFMLAGAAILASIGDRPFIRQARRAGVYAALVHYLFVSMRWCVYTSALSIPAILFDPIWKLSWYPFAFGIWGFVALTALFASLRALRVYSPRSCDMFLRTSALAIPNPLHPIRDPCFHRWRKVQALVNLAEVVSPSYEAP